MNFLWKNKFWIAIVLAVAAVIVCYCILVVPTQKVISGNTSKIKKTQKTLEDLVMEGSNIATDTKIKKCKETMEILEKEHVDVVEFFLKKGQERWRFWPDVVDGRGVPNGLLFQEKYNEETVLFVKDLAKDVELAEGVLPWVKFGPDVPEPEKCYPIMRDFWVIKDIAELIRSSEAVRRLDSLQLGSQEQQVLAVGEIKFYVRSLAITAHVQYPRLLFLIAQLQRSQRNIYVDSISIGKSGVSVGEGGEEPPVMVVLNCSMLRVQGPAKDEKG